MDFTPLANLGDARMAFLWKVQAPWINSANTPSLGYSVQQQCVVRGICGPTGENYFKSN